MFSLPVNQHLCIVFMHQYFKQDFYQLYISNRAELRLWHNWPKDNLNEEYFLQLINQSLNEYALGTSLQCAVSFKGQIIGYIGLTKMDYILGKAELGYWISAGYQGRGIMTMVCEKMIEFSFDFLKLNKIEISLATDNIGSRKICETLQFQLEGIQIRAESINGNVVNHARYFLLRNQYQSIYKNHTLA
ncbi:MAG: hypothetical protein OFPII_01850 [Osedax symbiont Rs1]|nr:MAG: hypothetical protein OFPII_01850 [Osedax symbiont Rs1]